MADATVNRIPAAKPLTLTHVNDDAYKAMRAGGMNDAQILAAFPAPVAPREGGIGRFSADDGSVTYTISPRVSKGGLSDAGREKPRMISIYGFGQFPLNVHAEAFEAIRAAFKAGAFDAWYDANKGQLSRKAR